MIELIALYQESEDLRCRDPPQTLSVHHVESIHEVEVSLLYENLLLSFKVHFVCDHIEQKLDEFSFVRLTERPSVAAHVASWNLARVDVGLVCHWWTLWEWS